MLLDILFGLGYVLLMVILLAAVMALCPKWGFALTGDDVKSTMSAYPEPPKQNKMICVTIMAVLIAVFGAMVLFAGLDGIRSGFSFPRLWLRFMVMMYIEKAFDLFVLDYLWVIKSGWFQRNFPELRDCDGLKNFKVFRREQVVRIIAFPFICAVLAGLFFIFT